MTFSSAPFPSWLQPLSYRFDQSATWCQSRSGRIPLSLAGWVRASRWSHHNSRITTHESRLTTHNALRCAWCSELATTPRTAFKSVYVFQLQPQLQRSSRLTFRRHHHGCRSWSSTGRRQSETRAHAQRTNLLGAAETRIRRCPQPCGALTTQPRRQHVRAALPRRCVATQKLEAE